MVNQSIQYIQGPKVNWTNDADLHRWLRDRREEAKSLMDTVLSHIKDKATRIKFFCLTDVKEAWTQQWTKQKRTV